MTGHHTEVQQRPAHQSEWYDASREALQTIAEGATQLAGFGVAAISVARDDGRLEVMAVAGSDAAREQLLGTRTPVDRLEREIEKADEWGLLRFVPHERLDADVGESWWVPDITPLAEPDAWHPLDLLIAPLYDEKGELRGTLAIDLPEDGKRPGPARRQLLQRYAEQAGRAVITALEREALSHQVRLAEAARDVVRHASAQLRLDRILSDIREALMAGFQARGMWIQTIDADCSSVEMAAALDIGHDLGRAILNARTFEREHQLVEELQALDTYKSQLIATVSHELKNPLTAIMGHLEMLESSPDLTGTTRASLAAMDRGANRMVRVVEDLLLLSKVGDPDNPVIPAPVDLRRIVDEVVDLTSVAASRKGITLRVDA